MAKYTTVVDAIQIEPTPAQKDTIQKEKSITTATGIQYKHDGASYFALVNISGEILRANEGDYLLIRHGQYTNVIPKAEFEAHHTPVKEKK